MGKGRTVLLWVAQVLLAALFVFSGLGKFSAGAADLFRQWGYPDSFHIVIGVLELLGGIALLVPRLAGFAAVLLVAIMIGATVTHLVHGESRWWFPLVLMVILGIIGYARRPGQVGRPDPAGP